MHFKKLGLVLVWGLLLVACGRPSEPDSGPPNFLLIITDDQRYDTMQAMPFTQEHIFDQGVTFESGYVTTPLCCPSRASILTGQYAHNTGVHSTADELFKPTFVDALNGSGYYTGMIGKYLNSWPGDTRPEFDYWAHLHGDYFDSPVNYNGETFVSPFYLTDEQEKYGLEFFDRAAAQDAPFMLIFAPLAPHDRKFGADSPLPRPPIARSEDRELFPDALMPGYETSFNRLDDAGKPQWITDPETFPVADMEQVYIENYRAHLQTLHSLDLTIQHLYEALDDHHMLDNTVIIFISDNGVQFGEHRLYGKRFPYEENIHVPFAIRYPPLVPEPYVENRLVANIDIAPTLYDLAGLPIPRDMDGLSLVKLIEQDGDWREALLFEMWSGGNDLYQYESYTGIHTQNYVYIDYYDIGFAEFYDLEADPFQLNNAINDPEYESVIAGLKDMLEAEYQASLQGND